MSIPPRREILLRLGRMIQTMRRVSSLSFYEIDQLDRLEDDVEKIEREFAALVDNYMVEKMYSRNRKRNKEAS